jgi:hypothetical protein
MTFGDAIKFAARMAIMLALLAGPAAIAAKGCPMCNQDVAASGPRTIHALNNGALILMFPPTLITAGIFYAGFKKRNKYRESESDSE